MSIVTAYTAPPAYVAPRPIVFGPTLGLVGPDVSVQPEVAPSAWSQAKAVFRPLGRKTSSAASEVPKVEKLRYVMPGLVMTQREFQIRFGSIPLDDYRERMAPAVFEAYVRFIGLVPGDPRFDVVEATADLDA